MLLVILPAIFNCLTMPSHTADSPPDRMNSLTHQMTSQT